MAESPQFGLGGECPWTSQERSWCSEVEKLLVESSTESYVIRRGAAVLHSAYGSTSREITRALTARGRMTYRPGDGTRRCTNGLCSEHESLAVLEVRVHIAMSAVYKSFSFDFDRADADASCPAATEGLAARTTAGVFAATWRSVGQSRRFAHTCLPSAIVPNELNLLLNRDTRFFKIDIHTATTSHWIGASFTDPGWVSRRRETAPRSSRKTQARSGLALVL